MTKRERSVDDRRAVLKHLKYEVDMLVFTAQGIASRVAAKSVIGNALVESFALHARNLIDFFWPDSHKTDHVLADHFFSDNAQWVQLRPTLSELLRTSRIRAHKEIAHLSYERLRVTDEKKEWSFVEIANEILAAFRIFESLLQPEYIDPEDGGAI